MDTFTLSQGAAKVLQGIALGAVLGGGSVVIANSKANAVQDEQILAVKHEQQKLEQRLDRMDTKLDRILERVTAP